MIGRYLAIVGVILVVVLGLAVWLKPPLAQVRNGVETSFADYVREHGVEPAPSDIQSNDWIIATSYSARLGEHVFACFGAMKVTVCTGPE